MDKKKKASKLIYWILIAVFACVFVFSGVIVVDYLMESQEHQDMMEDLRDLHTRGPEDEITTGTPTTRPSSSAPTGSSTVTEPTSGTTAPSTPADPTVPVDPTDPVDPTVPADPTIPADPTDPVDPTVPIEPTVPVDPTVPVEPTDPDPTEPSFPTEPTTPPTEPTTQPTTPPTEPPKPTVPTTPPHVNTTILSELKAIYDLNKDTVGWVSIKGTNIDYPVLQRKGNSSFYLYKNFYGKDDQRGSIYAQDISDVFTPSDVVVLYGHRMADGTMFNNVGYYIYDYYYKDHPYIQFDSLYARRKYEVVMIFRTNGAPHNIYPFFPFHTYSNFKDEAEFNYFMTSIRKLAVLESNIDVKYGDKLLCLCTCDYMPYPDGRLVLVAKLIQ